MLCDLSVKGLGSPIAADYSAGEFSKSFLGYGLSELPIDMRLIVETGQPLFVTCNLRRFVLDKCFRVCIIEVY